jgi:cytochrome bd-type quinol oxidase subunit 2
MAEVLNIVTLLAGIVAGLVGGIIINQALIFTGAFLVCIPFTMKLIDELLVRKLVEALIKCLGIMVFVAVCVWTVESGNKQLTTTFFDRPVLWLIVVGAGLVQLLWVLLVKPK